jgi:hypothetical protein
MKNSGKTVEAFVGGWGVSAHFTASRALLLQSALRGRPPGFRTRATKRSGPHLRIGASRGQIQIVEQDRPDLLLGTSRLALRSFVESWLESLASTRSPTFAFLHSGAVEVEGRVVLFPGRSCAGKSTLAAEFVKRGARYFSDDLVPIDRRLRAHPFPRPLGLRPSPGWVATRTSIESLGGNPAVRPRPVALVWCGSYDALAVRPTFQRQTPARAFAQLLANAPGAQIRPEVIVPILAGLARGVPVFTGRRGEAAKMVDAILRRL